ncbi:MAG: DUF1566 domain-containing protein [Alistipes sp.]|nr:DUF1566 domain-containing protein [Alistipes sp.]
MRTKLFVLALLAALFSVSVATAQFYNKKKVVITEVVDKAGDVSEGAKVFIRSSLTDAITNSEGYTGFCDVSIVSLEYNFERTGTISRETLSVIYQRYAAQYVLVSEINALDRESVLLTARIINTNTGEIINSATQRAVPDLDYLPAACNQLVGKLLREQPATASAQQPAASKRAAAAFFSSSSSVHASAPAPAVRTYKVGDYIEINGVGGVVFAVWNNGQNGKAVSLKEWKCDWNEARQRCNSLGQGWHLPTKSELQAVYNKKSAVNATLSSMAEGTIRDSHYWSSEEYTADGALYVGMGNGDTYNYRKFVNTYVRAVSAF